MWRTCDEAVLVKDQRVQLSTFIAAGQKVLLCSGNGDKTNAINCILRLIAWLVTDFNLKNYEIIRVLLFFLTIIRQIRLSLFHCRVILNSRKVRTGKIWAENLRCLQLAEVPALVSTAPLELLNCDIDTFEFLETFGAQALASLLRKSLLWL